MKECQDTRKREGKYQHQCPHCGTWNDYGVWGVAHDHLDLTYPSCQCGKKYRVLRRGCELAEGRAKCSTQTSRRASGRRK